MTYTSVDTLVRKAKPIFRLYIRLRDCDEYGYGNCITCGVKKHYTGANAGHFRHRVNSTYFLEDNCHFQCINCNFGGLGEGYTYGKVIDQRYGDGRADELKRLSFLEKRFTREEVTSMVEKWKEFIKQKKQILKENGAA